MHGIRSDDMKRLLMLSVLSAAMVIPMTGRASAGADMVRTVYFSAVDAKGVAVTDLTAADLTLKEGGKDRAIATVAAATAPMQISLLVDDAGSGGFQAAVAQFLQTMLGHAQFTIRSMNPQPSKLTDFTEDPAALQAAINNTGPRGPLKSSGASLSVVHLAGLTLGEVLGDGPKRSGGLIEQIGGGVVPGPVLAKVADNLLHQYVLTYTLPDGVKPNEKFSLTTTRKGVRLIAPSRIPDK
jgi:hypothetical protein